VIGSFACADPGRAIASSASSRAPTAAGGQAIAISDTGIDYNHPFLGGGFGVDSFDLQEASFSLVTLPPERLEPVQKAPHFDVPEQNVFALLHYLRVPAGSGTAFYRHRATRVERVTHDNIGAFVSASRKEIPAVANAAGYIHGSDAFYEQIASVEAVPDRVVIYHASLLHSGVIPADMSFSADPRQGRLTANIFLKS